MLDSLDVPRCLSRLFLIAALASGVAACSESEQAADLDCATLIREASYVAEVEMQVHRLDTAITGCNSYDEIVLAMERSPGIVGIPVADFLERRCADAPNRQVANSAVCRDAAPPTTTAPITAAGPVYVADTYDGERIEVTPDDVPFAGEVPAEIQQTVDRASIEGCPGVIAQRDEWFAQISDSRAGQIASLFALHAERVAEYIGCTATPELGTAVQPATTAPAP